MRKLIPLLMVLAQVPLVARARSAGSCGSDLPLNQVLWACDYLVHADFAGTDSRPGQDGEMLVSLQPKEFFLGEPQRTVLQVSALPGFPEQMKKVGTFVACVQKTPQRLELWRIYEVHPPPSTSCTLEGYRRAASFKQTLFSGRSPAEHSRFLINAVTDEHGGFDQSLVVAVMGWEQRPELDRDPIVERAKEAIDRLQVEPADGIRFLAKVDVDGRLHGREANLAAQLVGFLNAPSPRLHCPALVALRNTYPQVKDGGPGLGETLAPNAGPCLEEKELTRLRILWGRVASCPDRTGVRCQG